jgi:hypothetical protein
MSQRNMREAYAAYRHWLGWTRWEPGMLRDGRHGFYHLPRWVDNIDLLGEHLVRRARGQCIECRMPGDVHKPDCYHNWTIRDDLRQIAAPIRRLIVLGPRRRWLR